MFYVTTSVLSSNHLQITYLSSYLHYREGGLNRANFVFPCLFLTERWCGTMDVRRFTLFLYPKRIPKGPD